MGDITSLSLFGRCSKNGFVRLQLAGASKTLEAALV